MDPEDVVDDEPLDQDNLDQHDEDLTDPEPDDPEGDLIGDQDEDEPAPQPRQTRGQNRVQRVLAERDQHRERAERLERELAEARRGPAQPTISPEEAARRREAHLATLSEAGRLEFLINEERQERRAENARLAFQNWDASDASSFAALCASNPTANALKADVEKRLKELRDQGQNASRETVLRYVLGDRALNKAPKARAAARRTEAEGRERQTARPVDGRGDVSRDSGRRLDERAARRKRLEGMTI